MGANCVGKFVESCWTSGAVDIVVSEQWLVRALEEEAGDVLIEPVPKHTASRADTAYLDTFASPPLFTVKC